MTKIIDQFAAVREQIAKTGVACPESVTTDNGMYDAFLMAGDCLAAQGELTYVNSELNPTWIATKSLPAFLILGIVERRPIPHLDDTYLWLNEDLISWSWNRS